MTTLTIRELRYKLYLTQDELSEKLGVSRNTIHRWEINEHKAPKYVKDYLEILVEKKERNIESYKRLKI